MRLCVARATTILAACMCAATLAAAFPAHSTARHSGSVSAASPIWLRTELFFGLSRNMSGVVSPISDAEFDSFLDSTVTPLFPRGSSVIRGAGWFPQQTQGDTWDSSSSGSDSSDSSDSLLRGAPLHPRVGLRPTAVSPSLPLLAERCAVVILFHSDDGGTAAAIRTIWRNYTATFSQRSVLVSSQYSRVCFNAECPSSPSFVPSNGCGSGAAGTNPPNFQDAGAWRQASYPDDPAWMRTEALFSLGFHPDPMVGVAAWDAFVNEVIAPTFPDGFTVLNATGRFPQQADPPAPGWSTDASAEQFASSLNLRLPSPLLTGPARQLIAFHPDSRALAQRLHSLWPAYQSRFVNGQPAAPTGPAASQLLSAYTFVCSNDQCAPTSVFGNCSTLSALIAAGALANGSIPASLPSQSWDRTELFFGLSVQSGGGSGANTTGRISDAVFQSFVDTIIVPLFVDPLGTAQPIVGLNLVNSSGQYLNDAAVLIKEPSVQLTLTHANSDADAESIRKIWVNYTIEYQQESVLIDTQRAEVCFDNVCQCQSQHNPQQHSSENAATAKVQQRSSLVSLRLPCVCPQATRLTSSLSLPPPAAAAPRESLPLRCARQPPPPQLCFCSPSRRFFYTCNQPLSFAVQQFVSFIFTVASLCIVSVVSSQTASRPFFQSQPFPSEARSRSRIRRLIMSSSSRLISLQLQLHVDSASDPKQGRSRRTRHGARAYCAGHLR